MERVEINQIAGYLKDLQEGFHEQDRIRLIDLRHVAKLHVLVKRLMDAASASKARRLKVLLATLEHKARTCKGFIETRLAAKELRANDEGVLQICGN